MFKHILLLIPLFCLAAGFPNQSNVPGGIIHIPVADNHSAKPDIFFQDKKVLVVDYNKKWTAVVGIPLTANPGRHHIAVKTEEKESRIDFIVEEKDYPAQYIT